MDLLQVLDVVPGPRGKLFIIKLFVQKKVDYRTYFTFLKL